MNDLLPENKMPEAEVSLRLSFFIIEKKLTDSDIDIAIDGAQIKTGSSIHFKILEFLDSEDWIKVSDTENWRGIYQNHQYENKLKIHSSPGKGDVVAKLKSGQTLRAECKKGPLIPSKSSKEYPLIREALGQLITINEVAESDLLAVVVPNSSKFDKLAKK